MSEPEVFPHLNRDLQDISRGFQHSSADPFFTSMKKYKDTHYKLFLHKPGLPSGSVRICFFTDLHNCCSPREQQQIFDLLKKNQPDLLLCGGDSIIGKPGYPVEPAARFLTRLAEEWASSHTEGDPAGNLFVAMGNHEYRTRIYPEVYGDMYPCFLKAINKSGHIRLLQNEAISFTIRNLPIRICEFSMDRRYYGRIHHQPLPVSALSDIFGEIPPADHLSILLAHNPSALNTYLQWGADLTLCGHYHGGIIRFGKHTGLISPDLGLFTGKAYGLFQKDGKSVIVSSGCGEHTIPVRIHNPREIVTAEIHVNDNL